ncbi:hypothetical protein BGX33_002489 [Mortierella sp. NVP41]|nr:hypothetical protein BGX33_002489 [Mortierella sp. NVP41]
MDVRRTIWISTLHPRFHQKRLYSFCWAYVFVQGIRPEYVLGYRGDVVTSGKNYMVDCTDGCVTLEPHRDTWDYVTIRPQFPPLVVKFRLTIHCSPGYAVYESEESPSFASPIRIEPGYGERNVCLIKQDDYYWTDEESRNGYLMLRSLGAGYQLFCKFIPAGENLGFTH